MFTRQKQIANVICSIALSVFVIGCGGNGGSTASSEKAITAFSFTGPAAAGTVDETAKTISATVPYGTDVTALVAAFTTTGASVKVGSTVQESGTTPNDFIKPVVYTVTAADGSTADYTATVTVALNPAKAITAFSFTSPAAAGTVDEAAKTISATVPYGTDVTALVAAFTTTGASVKVGSTVQESGTTPNDFTNPVVYTVTAEDGSTADYTATVTVAGLINLPKTGQTTCYDSNGASVTCAGTGQDGDLQKGAAWPSPRFTTNADTTITDNLTGFAWASDAGAPTIGSCTGGPKSWQGALDYVACLNANSYLGYRDWRLPNVNELESLVNAGELNSAAWLNTQGFNNVQAKYYWSSTSYVAGPASAWYVDIYDGYSGVFIKDSKDSYYYVWPTRSGGTTSVIVPQTGQTTCSDAYGATVTCAGTGQDGDLQKGAAWPSPRFTTNADTTIKDKLTGLVWTSNGHAPGPEECTPASQKTWEGALDYVKCLNAKVYLGHADWRLPNRLELESLINYSQSDTAAWLNSRGFSNVQASYYWSSTSYATAPTVGWYVYMLDGRMSVYSKANGSYVWPVRGGQ